MHTPYINLTAPQKRSSKLIVVGTVALTLAALATLCIYQKHTAPKSMTFYQDIMSDDKQRAFLQFLAKYGKTYATKSDLNSRFEIFSEHYDRV